MTPEQQGNPETDEQHRTTEVNRFAADHRRELDDARPDVPVMEQLPDPGALPDPGYPEMPVPDSENPGGLTEPTPEQAPGTTEPRQASEQADDVSAGRAQAWPHPPAWAAAPLRPSFQPAPQSRTDPPVQAPPPPPAATGNRPAPPSPPSPPAHQEPQARTPDAHRPVWSPDPYAAPRAPDDAPPLRGPSVPWAEVRAAADYEAAAEPLAAPPSLRAHPWPPPETARASQAPAEELAQRPPTSEVLTSDLLLPGKRASPDGGWRRTVYRATGGLVRVGESSATMRRRDLVARIRTPVAGGHHRVAVLSLKGGVGKTTATVGLGATLASLRGDRVIAVDGNPDRGTLSDKLRLQTPATIRDLLNERALIARYADVRAFTSQAPSRLEILASDRDPGVSVAFSADDYRAVAAVLEHYYSVCITDCGTGLLHSAMAGILELADQIVLVSSPSVDGARSASATLDWLDAHSYGDLVRSGVVVLSAVRRRSRSAVDLDRLEQHFAARCRAVVRVPYDTHLEEGAEFELDYLHTETAEAYLTLAALVADGFAGPG
jgi:MinD-like ATPase involved in chromosome partitioning or flagellar assembly